MIDVLLTYPSDGARLFDSMIPIGLVSMATMLRDNGYEVRIIDFNHYCRDFRRDLLAWKPKIIGIGGTTPSRRGSFLTARLAKQVLPGVPVVYGGVHASFTAEDTLQSVPEIDLIVKGEGEHSFLALCNTLFRGTDTAFGQISGLSYRCGGEIVHNPAQRIRDLSLLPIPDRSLLPRRYGLRMEFLNKPGDFIITSRGCTVACNFCAASRMFPGGIAFRPINQIGCEIDQILTARPIAGLKLFDSTFTANRDHVLDFCRMIKPFGLLWECETRADTVDADLLRIMHEAGCYYINVGMETTNPLLLRKIGKGISKEQVMNVLDRCRDIGIRTKVFFTFGHIDQTYAECLEDLRFIRRNRRRIDFYGVTVGLRVYPGTRLERTCRERGLLGKNFSWAQRARSFRSLLLMEFGDIPIVFQRNLGPFALLKVLLLLVLQRTVCTPVFLISMMVQNMVSLAEAVIRHCRYTVHRLQRQVSGLSFSHTTGRG